MSDRVFITGLAIDATIGVYDWERTIKQRLVLDLEMCFDISTAASTDDLVHALDYSAVSQRIISFVEASAYQLLEALAEQVARIVMDEFSVSGLMLRMNKPGAVPEAAGVGLVITRGDYPKGERSLG
ncbi:dihydroneopterin aldolase [Alkalimarinus alittae]|uniref:7,8-dihydroneopterin aldolase n=1 Tax=Alkalimarinus alittae TaxID=2961619 RepID=A0ABY6N1C2_9ALTE|nr:dihydroneopterin aldolase [Alkalimarinus alittae]UZE95881.1 dihydroneopterin aldolase [Alkalimarinus alittae]